MSILVQSICCNHWMHWCCRKPRKLHGSTLRKCNAQIYVHELPHLQFVLTLRKIFNIQNYNYVNLDVNTAFFAYITLLNSLGVNISILIMRWQKIIKLTKLTEFEMNLHSRCSCRTCWFSDSQNVPNFLVQNVNGLNDIAPKDVEVYQAEGSI